MITRVHKNKKAKHLGRGGKRGKTSGRGGKGQTARAGNKRRPEMRDTIKKLPKRRGYGKNRARTVNSGTVKPVVLSLATISRLYKKGETVSLATLREKGFATKRGPHKPVKVLDRGELTIAVSVSGIPVSQGAREKIEKAGGSIA